jgi:hypothetical protein
LLRQFIVNAQKGEAKMANWTAAEELLRTWERRTRESQVAHYTAADRHRLRDRLLGIPAIALSTVVGTSVFATLQKELESRWKILLALLSILAAVLMTLHTSMGFSERAERHRVSGARYAGIRRRIEEVLALPRESRGEVAESLSSIRESMNKLAEESPALPPGLWDRSTKPLNSD